MAYRCEIDEKISRTIELCLIVRMKWHETAGIYTLKSSLLVWKD